MKNIYKKLFASIVILSLCLFLVEKVTLPRNLNLVIYEPIGYVIGSIYSFLFISLYGLFTSLYYFKNKKDKVKRFPYKYLIAGFAVGIIINQLNYFFIIKENHLIKCPPEIGYKKNLADTYVTDLNYCKKYD